MSTRPQAAASSAGSSCRGSKPYTSLRGRRRPQEGNDRTGKTGMGGERGVAVHGQGQRLPTPTDPHQQPLSITTSQGQCGESSIPRLSEFPFPPPALHHSTQKVWPCFPPSWPALGNEETQALSERRWTTANEARPQVALRDCHVSKQTRAGPPEDAQGKFYVPRGQGVVLEMGSPPLFWSSGSRNTNAFVHGSYLWPLSKSLNR